MWCCEIQVESCSFDHRESQGNARWKCKCKAAPLWAISDRKALQRLHQEVIRTSDRHACYDKSMSALSDRCIKGTAM